VTTDDSASSGRDSTTDAPIDDAAGSADLIAITGTPGTGKTTATDRLDRPVVHLNALVRDEGLDTGVDPERGSRIVDLEAVEDRIAERVRATDGPLVVESHVAHELGADRVIVLRCAPEIVAERLRDRGESGATARENAESEALDLVLSAAVERHGEGVVYEIDATDSPPSAVADAIEAAIAGDREPSAGMVAFDAYLDRVVERDSAPGTNRRGGR